MKNIYFFVILLMNYFASAQLNFRANLGINTTNLNYETVHGQIKGATGLSFGGDIQFGKRVYIQPGINYTAKKFKIDGFGEIQANKINLPILFGYRLFTPTNNLTNNVRFFLGPNFSTTISEKISDAITDINKDDLNNFNIAGIGGIGIDVNMFFVDLGYKYGLNNFMNNGGKTASLNGFLVNLGVRF